MKVENYRQPKSSFLSPEKDLGILTNLFLKNQRLKKLLYYTVPDALDRPALTEDQSLELFQKNIKIVPKMYVDGDVRQYLLINFDLFTANATNPQFRDNLIMFDIVCHYDQWPLKDFQLRPYRIAAEIDSMISEQRLTGIGKLHFLSAEEISLNDEFAGLRVIYVAIHGEEDKKFMPNPNDEQSFLDNFNEMFNGE